MWYLETTVWGGGPAAGVDGGARRQEGQNFPEHLRVCKENSTGRECFQGGSCGSRDRGKRPSGVSGGPGTVWCGQSKKNPHRIRQGAVGDEASRSELGQLGMSLTTHRRPRKWFRVDHGLNSVNVHTESLLRIVWTPVDMKGW